MSSLADPERNLAEMEGLVARAKGQGAEAIAFPEMAYLMGGTKDWVPWVPRYRELLERFAGWARRHKLLLLPGSLREPVPGHPDRYYNTLPLFAPDGSLVTQYRKLYLFKASLPDRNYDEGQHCTAGDEIVVAETEHLTPETPLTLGLSICFDLRFPELFRALKRRGAQVVVVPAAFTVPTGRAHWEVLLRARAIENQCFIVAPAQTGTVGEGKATYGHSLVVAPWGEILADLGDAPGLAVVPLDLAKIAEARGRVGAWPTPRPDVLPIA